MPLASRVQPEIRRGERLLVASVAEEGMRGGDGPEAGSCRRPAAAPPARADIGGVAAEDRDLVVPHQRHSRGL